MFVICDVAEECFEISSFENCLGRRRGVDVKSKSSKALHEVAERLAGKQSGPARILHPLYGERPIVSLLVQSYPLVDVVMVH